VSYLLIILAASGPPFVSMSSWEAVDMPPIVAAVPGITITPLSLIY
jgi:hypothetical protein